MSETLYPMFATFRICSERPTQGTVLEEHESPHRDDYEPIE
jgi:hypothetical protein